MDKDTEKKICDSFFDKRSSDRLFYELSSKKKRADFLNRMCHTAGSYIGNCISEKFDMPPTKEQIRVFLNDDICYFITSYNDTDGNFCDTSDTLERIWSNGWAYMAVNRDCSRAYLETEYDHSSHTAYFLEKGLQPV